MLMGTLLLTSLNSWSQSVASNLVSAPFREGNHYYSVGGVAGRNFFGEAGIGLAYWGGMDGAALAQYGYSLACEVGRAEGDWIVGPKLSYTISAILVNTGVNVIYYNVGDKSQPYFRPQVGFTFFGYVDAVYGYNLPISSRPPDNRLSPISSHVFSFVVRIAPVVLQGSPERRVPAYPE